MALTEQSVIESITILEDGQMEIRRADKIFKDGVGIEGFAKLHRHVLAPGDDLTGQDARVSKIAKAVWTLAVVKKYKDRLAAVKVRS